MIIKKPIFTNRLLLDPFKTKDVTEEYLSWMKDTRLTQYILKASKEITKNDLDKFVEELDKSNENIFFRIVLKNLNLHIGNIRLGPIDYANNYSKFGILIGNKNYHNMGYAQESIEAVIDFCFKNLKLNLFKFECVKNNLAAMSLYEKMGFKRKNIEEKFVKENIKHDQVMWYRENY